MNFTVQQLLDHARRRPPGYLEEVLAACGITDVSALEPFFILHLPPSDLQRLRAKYQPTLKSLALDYQTVTAPWRAAPLEVLAEPAADHRADTCALCSEFRLKEGRLVCRAWGCEPLPFWLKLQACLLAKWPSKTAV